MVRTGRSWVRVRRAFFPQYGQGAFFGAQKTGISTTVGALASMPASSWKKAHNLFLGRRFQTSTPPRFTRWRSARSVEKSAAHDRPSNNNEVIEEARKLARGKTIFLFQPRL